MEIGKVIGKIVATRKDESLSGVRLFIVQPLNESLEPHGDPIVATDTERVAGHGDLVFMVSGGDAAEVIPGKSIPVDIAIVGLIDSIHVNGSRLR